MLMVKNLIYIVSIPILVLLIAGCSTTRHLAEEEKLYTGAKVKFEKEDKIYDKREVRRELEEVLRPSPNDKFLGLFRHRLWFYNIAGEDAEGGIRGWIRRRLGQPPVLLDHANPENTSVLMVNRMENQGYFNAEIEYETRERRRTANIVYTVRPGHPYLINNITFPEPETELTEEIRRAGDETILREGEIFKLARLRKERERIDIQLKNRGFYFFNADYIRFRADSTVGEHKVNLYLAVRDGIPDEAKKRYRVGNIFVYPDYALGRDETAADPDTVFTHDKYIIQHNGRFKPEMFTRFVFLNTGEYYNRQDHVLTINRLMGLGTFRFVNIRFHQNKEAADATLDTHIYLRPVYERTLRAEFRAVSKSNDLAGPGLNMGYRNRNFFRGAESFSVDLNSSFETQLGGRRRGMLDQYHIGIETELQIPRIISPVPIFTRESLFVPRTRIRLGYEVVDRLDELRLNSFSTRFGYVWMSGRYVRQEFDPVSVNYVRSRLHNPTVETENQLDPVFLRGLEPQFIIGSTYSLFFNNQTDARRRIHVYFNFNLDLSGNTLHLLNTLFRSDEATEDSPFTLFGISYSQYSRADFDLRYYMKTGQNSRLVTRMIAGAGIPYGNSASMPYVKQFFTGGTNSIRAFPARSLGPGTLSPPEDERSRIDRTGDIRIETNLEYRFPLVSIVRGALFVDAGNIWMIRSDGAREGTAFNFDTFLGEFAVGAGFGLRLDASFFVLRFDLAFPLRKPYLATGERWVIDEIDFGSSQWRRDNLTFNIAIGYPF